MKIVLTGGGTGGHFYPIIAVVQELRNIVKEQHLIEPELIYMAPEEYDADALYENNITFRQIPAGKQRRYVSIKNFFDIFKTGWGTLKAVVRLFFIFPDVVFSKGGYASVPVVLAARLFGIPLIVHESDASPGKANLWAARYARRIAISYPETAEHFERITAKKKKAVPIAVTGNPVRHEFTTLATSGAHEFLKLSHDTPTILVVGGSSGATTINETLIEALPELVERYQVIHQAGKDNFDIVRESGHLVLEKSQYTERYKLFPFLNVIGMRMAAGAADLVVSRAGSGAIFEIATWGKPSVLIPIPKDVSHDQIHNAFAYARTGAAVVVAQENLTPHLLVSEINRIMDSEDIRTAMATQARAFAQPLAGRKIAQVILDVALEHEE